MNHNENFISKYDDKSAFYINSFYNGNKYNLKRNFDEPVIHYKTQDFIPDSYYEYNLKNTDHKKMMLNNIETENEISNDFNRRQRQSESGQPLQKIKDEDNERAESLKKLLDQFNSNIIHAESIQDIEEYTDKTNVKVKKLNNEYHRPKINKAIEDIEFNNTINKIKKLDTSFNDNDATDAKQYYYRQDKNKKKEVNKELKIELEKEIKKIELEEEIEKKIMKI